MVKFKRVRIARIIKRARVRAGLHIKDAALVLKVTRPTLDNWEAARVPPNADGISKLCVLYNLDANALLGLAHESCRTKGQQ